MNQSGRGKSVGLMFKLIRASKTRQNLNVQHFSKNAD